MSTPAGQSLAHALQDRHRSSDSCTSADVQSAIKAPFVSSWSTRALPLVTSFSSPEARYDGHMNPPAATVSARQLPTPTHRCTAVVKSPASLEKLNPSVASSDF